MDKFFGLPFFKKNNVDAIFLMGTEDFLCVGSLSSQRNVHCVQ